MTSRRFIPVYGVVGGGCHATGGKCYDTRGAALPDTESVVDRTAAPPQPSLCEILQFQRARPAQQSAPHPCPLSSAAWSVTLSPSLRHPSPVSPPQRAHVCAPPRPRQSHRPWSEITRPAGVPGTPVTPVPAPPRPGPTPLRCSVPRDTPGRRTVPTAPPSPPVFRAAPLPRPSSGHVGGESRKPPRRRPRPGHLGQSWSTVHGQHMLPTYPPPSSRALRLLSDLPEPPTRPHSGGPSLWAPRRLPGPTRACTMHCADDGLQLESGRHPTLS